MSRESTPSICTSLTPTLTSSPLTSPTPSPMTDTNVVSSHTSSRSKSQQPKRKSRPLFRGNKLLRESATSAFRSPLATPTSKKGIPDEILVDEEGAEPKDQSSEAAQPFPGASSKDKSSPLVTPRPRGGHRIVLSCISGLPELYRRCNPSFSFHSLHNPKRTLTEPSEGVANHGCDNVNGNLILSVHDILHSETGPLRSFKVIDILGEGTFGQVARCENLQFRSDGAENPLGMAKEVAIKVIKNKVAYFNQAHVEISILSELRDVHDKEGNRHLLRLRDCFIYRKHQCLVFDLLSINIYELLKQNKFRGLSCSLIRTFLVQILDAMQVLVEACILHCDLKPENILLESPSDVGIQVIDFGSACHTHSAFYSYIQSRFYRAPEVLLGLPYSHPIDMWSLGCIVAELFLGVPLFPGKTQHAMLQRMIAVTGKHPPETMLAAGSKSRVFFFPPGASKAESGESFSGSPSEWRFKTQAQWCKEQGVEPHQIKKYFKGDQLEEIIFRYKSRRSAVGSSKQDLADREVLVHFLTLCLDWDPETRLTVDEALVHPFINPALTIDSFKRETKEERKLKEALRAAAAASHAAAAAKFAEENTTALETIGNSGAQQTKTTRAPLLKKSSSSPDLSRYFLDATSLPASSSSSSAHPEGPPEPPGLQFKLPPRGGRQRQRRISEQEQQEMDAFDHHHQQQHAYAQQLASDYAGQAGQWQQAHAAFVQQQQIQQHQQYYMQMQMQQYQFMMNLQRQQQQLSQHNQPENELNQQRPPQQNPFIDPAMFAWGGFPPNNNGPKAPE